MAQSPKRSLRNVFSREIILDDDPDEYDRDEDERNEDWQLRRVTSRVQSCEADGSAEAVLAGPPTLPLSSTVPVMRTRSTPLSSTNRAGGCSPRKSPNRCGNVNNSPSKVAYAMRKVFSREEKSEWREQEAEELVRNRHHQSSHESVEVVDHDYDSHAAPSPCRVTSYGEDEGAELVMGDDGEFDDVDVDGRSSLEANLATAMTENAAAKATTRFGIGSGYKLRRFLSTPSSSGKGQRKGASVLRRTPSYEPQGYNEQGEAEYDEDYEKESPLYHNDDEQPRRNSPVGLKRTLSLRRKISSPTKGQTHGKSMNVEDEDLSTVAESVDSSFSGDGSKTKKRRSILKIVFVATFLLVLGVAGVGAYVMLGDRRSGEGMSTKSQLENFEVPLQMMGDDDGDDLAAADVSIEIRTDDEEIPSRDAGGKPQEAPQGESRPFQTESNPYDSYPSTPAVPPEPTTSDAAILTTSPPPTANPSEQSTTVKPSNEPTGKPTTKYPTHAPTGDTYTKFYVMADCPYDDNERQNLMPGYISDLSTDAEFLFHLGDLQYAMVDYCQEYAYREASDILKKSPIPTFVLPGDNDINDCEDHKHGERMWEKYFSRPDERWGPGHSLDVTRWGTLGESFSFLHKGVLYFGLNIVGGSPYSNSEKRKRHEEHLLSIRRILDETEEGDFQVIVLLGHADPSDHHNDFFRGSHGFASIVEELGKPTIHFHGDWHEWYEVEGDFGVENYMRISLDGESVAPPILVEIDVGRENPVRVSRRRSGLDVDCCAYGWPRHDEL